MLNEFDVSKQFRNSNKAILAAAAFIEALFFASYSYIPPVRDLFSVRIFIIIFFIHAIFSAAIVLYIIRSKTIVSRRSIIIIYIISRIATFPMAPWLSDDVFGYLFYGRELISGVNPYSIEANSPAISYLRNDAYNQMAFQRYPAIYPPFSIYFFGISVSVGNLFSNNWQSSFYAWKIILFAHEFAALILLAFTRLHKYVSPIYLLAYIIMPLPAVEIIGQGHCDGLTLPYIALFLFFPLIIYQNKNISRAATNTALILTGASAGFLAAIKLIPVVLFGGVLIAKKNFLTVKSKAISTAGLLTVLIASFAPPLRDAGSINNFFKTLSFYNNTYFNSPPLMFLRYILEAFHIHNWWLAAPYILTIVRVACIVALMVFLRPATFISFIEATSILFATSIIISPKVHSWYFVPLLFMTTFTRRKWIIAFSYTTVASYLMYGYLERRELFILEYILWSVAISYIIYDLRRNGFYLKETVYE